MTHGPPLDQRALKERRDQALWRTKVAGMVAFASAALSVVIFAFIGFDTGDWTTVLPFLIGAGLTFGFGAGIYFAQSQLAAGVLMLLALLSAVLRIVQTGQFGGVVIAALVIYAYFQGLNGAMDLAELRKLESMPPDPAT